LKMIHNLISRRIEDRQPGNRRMIRKKRPSRITQFKQLGTSTCRSRECAKEEEKKWSTLHIGEAGDLTIKNKQRG